MRKCFFWSCILLALPSLAAERRFDFGQPGEGRVPAGFRSTVSGKGKPGEWKVLLDEVPSLLPAVSPQAAPAARQPVLAQLAQDPTDEHFPLLVYDDEVYGDFTLTTRFKTIRGVIEQMAGMAFRIQNESNYYVVRASSLGNTFRFYKVVNGERGTIIGPEMEIPSGVWHDLLIDCHGNQIRCQLDGRDVIPTLTDSSFLSGRIGFWTKSDSVSYFSGTRIVYTPREAPAQTLVRAALKRYPRLVGLKIYVPGADAETTRLIASGDERELGGAGGKTEREVIRGGQVFYGKEPEATSVIMPLRDKNGETMAAVRVVMRPFKGQTEENAIVRAAPIVKEIQSKVQTLPDLTD